MRDDQLLRYSRHIMLPEIGINGQYNLLKSHVLIIGAGGLGCPTGLYLAASGVGTIAISDFDYIELSNLQRQIGHFTVDINKSKTKSLTDKIIALNPDILTYELPKMSGSLLIKEVNKADIVIDCSDNFDTRDNINTICIKQKKILISGSIAGFTGQLSIFAPHLGYPCYRCIYPEAPKEKTSCALSGVVSPIAGIIGSMQALEALKILTKIKQKHKGKLIVFDAVTSDFKTYFVKKDKNCLACGIT